MLKYVLVFVAVVACAYGAAIPDGLLAQLDGRIVGGYPTTIGAHPYQVSIQRSRSHFCGGAIYSKNVIVTAAHCLQNGIQASSLSIRIGSTNWNSGGTVISVKSYINHPNYNGKTMENDIALLKLSSDITFTYPVRAISLASSNPANGANAVVSGWGTESSGSQSIPSQLRAVDVKILDRSSCASKQYKYGSEIRSGMICAFAVNKDACQGDSGGPLVSGNQLVGVVSWGRGCADSRYPGVYADVASYRSWVVTNSY